MVEDDEIGGRSILGVGNGLGTKVQKVLKIMKRGELAEVNEMT